MKYIKMETGSFNFCHAMLDVISEYKKYRKVMIKKDALKKCANLFKKSKIRVVNSKTGKVMEKIELIKAIDGILYNGQHYENTYGN